MISSKNVLVIESLSCEPEMGLTFARINCCLNAEVKFMCPITGNHYSSIELQATNTGYSLEDAIKNTISDFLFGRVHVQIGISNCHHECQTDNKNIHHIDIQLQEPFKSLFVDLFDILKWEIPKRQLSEQ